VIIGISSIAHRQSRPARRLLTHAIGSIESHLQIQFAAPSLAVPDSRESVTTYTTGKRARGKFPGKSRG
jgi:hypothetical protein